MLQNIYHFISKDNAEAAIKTSRVQRILGNRLALQKELE